MFLLILVDAYVASLNSVLYLFFLKYRLAKNKRQIASKSKHWEIDFLNSWCRNKTNTYYLF